MRESSNERPGEPPRRWLDVTDVNEIDVDLLIVMSGTREILASLPGGVRLGKGDVARLALLNVLSEQRSYEPLVELLTSDRARVLPGLEDFVLRATERVKSSSLGDNSTPLNPQDFGIA